MIDQSNVEGKIFTNGKKAFSLYRRYQEPVLGRAAVLLPSTSPANAAMKLDELERIWRSAIVSGDV